MIQEFKEFALKGNVMDLAVGVIIGAAFGKIVDSLVKNIIMPIVAAAGGSPKFDFKVGPIEAGAFVTTVIDFVILAFCIFMMVKLMNAARRRMEKPATPAAPAAPPASETYLKEIRDLLAKK
ncbi:MAG TPA: large conductance mechanosensitive channel protein MscL [Hyphomicrobiaceae bacterium]|nr:large conductance mechanosensitive channel protein MscL [Hyphomicrobiaceae bacterium]